MENNQILSEEYSGLVIEHEEETDTDFGGAFSTYTKITTTKFDKFKVPLKLPDSYGSSFIPILFNQDICCIHCNVKAWIVFEYSVCAIIPPSILKRIKMESLDFSKKISKWTLELTVNLGLVIFSLLLAIGLFLYFKDDKDIIAKYIICGLLGLSALGLLIDIIIKYFTPSKEDYRFKIKTQEEAEFLKKIEGISFISEINLISGVPSGHFIYLK